jgi:uncharacterized damage-inducible protein DinB
MQQFRRIIEKSIRRLIFSHMSVQKLPEVWLRGPLHGIPGLLQPVAHALMQALEEVKDIMKDFPEKYLWVKPAGLASPAFHLQHIAGVIDRLFTYAQGSSLSENQFSALKAEGLNEGQTVQQLLDALSNKIDWALEQLKQMEESNLLEPRVVGRSRLPSTVLGLFFHSAEHTMRHVGQLLVTVRTIQNTSQNSALE